MPKDIRNRLSKSQLKSTPLSKNHRAKFESKLHKELHQSKKGERFNWLKIAASIALLIGLGSITYFSTHSQPDVTPVSTKTLSLGSLSPEMNKLENYYITSINYEISNLVENKENKELLDSYLEKIGELTKEYKNLTEELNTNGLNESTINALINNLQLRLKLLLQLKEQLNELKTVKNRNDEIKQV